jgi:glycosyltransferase involved in cell wall biosynthesis
MKVALVCDWYHPRVGGIELHLQDLAARLVGAGHDVVVITSTPGALQVDGIRIRRIAAPRAPLFGFLITPAGVRAVGDAMAAERVDVAHCHVSIVSPAALGGARHAERRGIPTVVTFHSIVPQMRLLARSANRALGMSHWRAKYSAVSARVARDVQAIAGSQSVVVLSNGIDVEYWRGAAPRDDDGVTRLITVMRLNSKKRPLALVGIMRRVISLLDGGRRVHLRVVGDGPHRAKLERSIAQNGMADHIELLGRLSRDEIKRELAGSDVFVLPTVRESFGLAALEARCAALPVVAMRASGVSEFIDHEREGLLADSDDEIATYVASLAADPARRVAIAGHNRQTTPPFDWPRTLDAHVALYRDAIALRASV